MLFNLGIDVASERIVAAAERSGSVRVVTLGRSTREVRPAAYVESDGTVRVGDEAIGRGAVDPEGLVNDVTAWLGDGADHRVHGWSVTGDVLFAHVLAAVVRQAAQQGDELGRVTLVHPASWSGAQIEALKTAATNAGMLDVDLVSPERAIERAPANVRDDALRAAAVGAAALAAGRRPAASAAPTQVVAPVAQDAVPAPDPVTGMIAATSVFGADDLDLPPFEPGAGSGDDGGLPPMVPPAGGGFEPPDRNRVPFYVAGGVLAVLVIVLLAVLLTRGGDDDDGTATGDSTTTSSSTSSTTSTSTTTSTTSTTTSTTTTTAPTSTTTPSPTTLPREIGKAGLLEDGLVLGYGTSASQTLFFGDRVGDTMVALQEALGSPSSDTGWKRDEKCFGDSSRRVKWGDLEVVFTETEDAGSPDPVRTFEQWFVSAPGTNPPGLNTLDRIGIGSTVADLKRAYADLEISRPIQGNKAGFFTTKPEGQDLIAGWTTDTDDSARVAEMWAGAACERLER